MDDKPDKRGMDSVSENGWNEYKLLIMSRLDATDRKLDLLKQDGKRDHREIMEKLMSMSEKIAKDKLDASLDIKELKVKSGIIGFIGGAIPGLAYILVQMVKNA